MTRSLGWIAALLILIVPAASCYQARPASTTTVTITTNPCDVALAPGGQQTDRDREIARAQADARDTARERQSLERLGYLFVSRARVNNDAGDYRLAEAAAACMSAKDSGDAPALLLRGHVLHQMHRFREAEQIARVLVTKRTYALDYGLLGDTLMEQGRLLDAEAAYQRMIDLKPFYQSYTRAAHLRWIKGDLDGAIESMRLAIGSASPRDPESSAWAWTRLAAYELQARRFGEAQKAIDAALTYHANYAAALLVRGRVLLALNRRSEAIDVLRRAEILNPLPEYQWMLADALRLDGHGAEAAIVEQTLMARGASLDPRTLALFLATRRTNIAKAMSLAEEELQVRADVFTLDAKAWALAAGGRVGEASDLMEKATAEGTMDGRLFLHAGIIHAAAGRADESRRWLKKAAALRSTLLPSESAELTHYLTGSN